MALDLDTRLFLEAAAGAPGQPIEEMSVADSRRAFEDLFIKLGPKAVEVGEVIDCHAPTSQGERIPCRIYHRPRHPRPRTSGVGALVFAHGGGWSLGSLDSYDTVMRWICARAGIVVASVAYRLAPEHKFPSQISDLSRALAWFRNTAERFGVNPRRIAIGGDSCGGTLATVVCLEDRGAGDPPLAAQVLFYPLLTLASDPLFPSRSQFGGGEYFLSQRGIDEAASRYLHAEDDVTAPRVSPLRTPDVSGLPPTLIVTAGFDPLRDEGAAYCDILRSAGVPTDYRCYESTIHGFVSFAGTLRIGREALDQSSNWLARRLAT